MIRLESDRLILFCLQNTFATKGRNFELHIELV
jgi:hypothetical protein